tara:strand:- start:3113 stop:3400 length:288 start_codon:yes stop_codon:yes gene_type:complete
MITDEFEEHYIYMQIEFEDKSKWGNFGKNKYIQNHLLRLFNIMGKLKQIVVEDDVLYKIEDIPDLLPEAFDYPDNESSSLNNDIKLMFSDSENEV